MPYSDWLPRHEHLAVCRFVRLRDLISALHRARHISFSVKSVRDEVRTSITDLMTTTVDRDIRFPDGVYVNTSFGIVAEALDRIMMALDHGERSLDREQTTGAKFTELGDSKIAFIKGLQSILQILARDPNTTAGEGVYSQLSFERHFSLHWQP